MEKLEQIQNLLIEWQKENPEKRVVILNAIEVEKESKNAYSLSVTGAIMGDEAVIVEYFADCITNSENPLHSVIGKAIKKVAMRGFMKRIGNIAGDLLEVMKDFEKSANGNSEDNNK